MRAVEQTIAAALDDVDLVVQPVNESAAVTAEKRVADLFFAQVECLGKRDQSGVLSARTRPQQKTPSTLRPGCAAAPRPQRLSY